VIVSLASAGASAELLVLLGVAESPPFAALFPDPHAVNKLIDMVNANTDAHTCIFLIAKNPPPG
jgi:hypothetical protein